MILSIFVAGLPSVAFGEKMPNKTTKEEILEEDKAEEKRLKENKAPVEKLAKEEALEEGEESQAPSKEEEFNQILAALKENISRLEEEIVKLKKENRRISKVAEQGIGEKIPVLMYHHLYNGNLKESPFKNNSAVISVDMFKEQMKYLHDNGFYTATLEELERFLNKEIPLPKKTVVITFDDGYYSNIEYAYPILKKYGFKATIFVVGNKAKNASKDHNLKTGTLRGLSYEDMNKTSDVFDFQSHTYDKHHRIDNRAALLTLTKEEMLEDFTSIKEELNTRYFAYPFGAYNGTVIEALKETGHALAFTIKSGYVTVNSPKYELPRFTISPLTSLEKFKNIVNQK